MNPVLQRIRKKVARGNVPTAIAVYVALCEAINNEGDGYSIVASHSDIGDLCFLSVDTVLKRLRDLRHAGVIVVKPLGSGEKNKYTLPNKSAGLPH